MSRRPRPGEARALRNWLDWAAPFVLLLAATAALVARPGAVERLHEEVFDAYQRRRPRPYVDAGVRVVDVDDDSLARLGQWPWPRTVLARAVDRLARAGVKAIAFDIVFSEPDRTSPRQVLPLWGAAAGGLAARVDALPDHDLVLARALAAAPAVLGSVLNFSGNGAAPRVKTSYVFPAGDPTAGLPDFTGAVTNLPALERAAKGNGSFTYLADGGSRVRRMQLVARRGDTLVPAMILEALRVAQGADTIAVKAAQVAGEAPGIGKLKVGGLVIPTDEWGRVRIRFRRTVPDNTIPFWRLFDPGYDGAGLDGAIVLVGSSASALLDQRETPLSPIEPGVQVLAQTTEQLLLGIFLTRPPWATDAEAAFLLLAGALLIWVARRWGGAWGASFCVFGVASAFALAWWAFLRRGLLFDPVPPSAALALMYFAFATAAYVQREREKRAIRDAFSHYLAPELVERLARRPEGLALGGETRRMTFHFCDIENFTGLAEFYDPFALIRFLNGFLSPLTDVILRHHGTIDKYIGDCIMAFWNAPLDDPRHGANACLAAVEMHERLKDLNEERRAQAEARGEAFAPVRIRTGLNTGNAIVGNMGSARRLSYSVLGDEVNVASRLEGANKLFGTRLMASESTVRAAEGAVEARLLGSVRLVGKIVPLRVYEILARSEELSEPWRRALPVYGEALSRYYARDFERAVEGFERVLEIFPEDGPSSVYLKACGEFAVAAPPNDWDGVIHLTRK